MWIERNKVRKKGRYRNRKRNRKKSRKMGVNTLTGLSNRSGIIHKSEIKKSNNHLY